MRAWGKTPIRRVAAGITAGAAVLLGFPMAAMAAPGPLTITPIGWNIVGLDSNNVTDGPNAFPIGGRVCNTGTNPVTNVTVDWVWDSADPYIGLTGFSQYTQVSLAAGACRDVYFNVQITRDSAAYDNTRDFHITADGDVVSPVSTPASREIYVEKLVSQGRNAVNSWILSNTPGCNPATGVVYVGSTCTATISSKTATGGYEQLVNAYYFNNSMFRIESILNTYDKPSGFTNSQMYADACGWDNDTTSGTYRSCKGPDLIPGGKAGGDPISTVVTFTIVGTGAQTLTGLIYDFSGSSFHYNSDSGTPPNLLALTATYAPTAPDTEPDSATTDEDTFVDVNVLANDTDINGNLNASSLSVATQPSNGTAAVVGGQVRYTPDPDFSGTDTFTYQICDSTAPTPLCSTETVTITVDAVNDGPVAVDDVDTTDEDVAVDVDVLGNDTDADGDTLSIDSFTQGSDGTVSDNGDGTLKYTPDAGFFGTDTFTYTVDDGNGGSDTATVTITVDSVNDVPVAVDDADTTDEDVAVDVDVLGNDTDADGDTLSIDSFTQGSNGTVSDNGDGTLKYTPNGNFFGTDTFTYTVDDGNGGTDTATVTITVDSVNDDPVAVDDADTTDQDVPVDVDVLTNDTDADGDTLSIDSFTQGSNGTVSDNGDGTLKYIPDAGFFGTDTFNYTVDDGNGGADTATVTITVDSVNDVPVAVDDADTTDEDVAVDVDVLTNDTDADGDTLSIDSFTQGSNGTVSDNGDGTLKYTPNANFLGTDTFTYTVDDGNGGTDTATVTITVDSVNDVPVAVDDADTTDEDVAVDVDVLTNDTDADADSLSVDSFTQGSDGTVSDNGDGTLKYTPDAGFFGTDTFTYTVDDGNGGSDTATVTITIDSVNDVPVAVDDADTTDEDVAVDVDVLGNDTDADGDTLSIDSFTQGSDGTVSDNGDGTLKYTPNANFFGTDTFTYTVDDGNGGTDTATVTITVDPMSDDPVASPDSVTVDEDDSVTFDVTTNDTDGDGDLDPTTITVTSGPNNGTLSNNGDGTFDYSPDPDFNGTDTFSYEICDDNGACDTTTVTITVNPVNDAPVAADDNELVDQNQPTVIDVLVNDNDVDGDALVVTIDSSPANGGAVVNGDGTITYSPDPGYTGSDSFTYTICDPTLECDTATVTITVADLPEPPLAVDDADSLDEDSGDVIVDVVENDTDPENDIAPSTVAVTAQPANGTAISNGDGTVTYTPDPDFNGSDTFTYEVCDTTANCDTAVVTITVNAVDDAPTAVDDTATVDEDAGPVTINVTTNDVDVDGDLDPTTAAIVSGPASGTITNNNDGTFDYDPDPDFSGTDSFVYEVCDASAECAQATVTITVNEVNDPPAAADDSDSVNEDGSVDVDVLANDSDPDDGLDPVSVTVIAPPANGSATPNLDGTITYTPDADYFGADSFSYEVCDFVGACATAQVDISVDPVNDVPAAGDDIGTVDEDSGPVTIDVLANDADPEGDSLTVTSAGPASNGTVTVNPDGTVDYEPDPDFSGTDSFTYDVCDSSNVCATATVTVTVNGVNDSPVAVDDSDTTSEDTPVDIDVIANDTDVDSATLTVDTFADGANGTVTINGNGTLRYTPDAGWSGTDAFTYTACDADGACDGATVTVDVTDVNDPPVANDDVDSAIWGVPVDIDVAANDTDSDGSLDLGTLSISSAPSDGAATANNDGTVTYTADDGFVGTDTFTYEICDDGSPSQCDTAVVTITVSANEGPDAVDDADSVDEDSGPVTINVLGNDSDPEGGALTVSSTGPASNGTVTLNGNGTIDYEPDPDFDGIDTFAYTVCDEDGLCSSATVTVTVNPVNDGPDAVDDVETVLAGATVTVDVLSNDSDVDGTLDTSSVSIVTGPLHGSVTVNGNGTIDYTADAAYAGADSFQYEVCDNDGACASATVSITVTSLAGNNPPIAVNDFDTTDEDTPIRIAVRSNDSDPDADTLSIGSFTQSTHGTVRRAGGALRYTPDTNWNGTDTFTYEVCDPDGACDTATVTVVVDPVNDAPVAHNDAVRTKPGKPVDIPVTFNDEEPDGDAIVVTVMEQPAHGAVIVQPDGTVVYRSAGSYAGADSFTYEICDPDGDCSTATVSVVVQGGGTPPQDEPDDPQPDNPQPGDPGDDPAPQGGTLPHTGIELLQLMLWGATLLAGGLVLVSRRPRWH